MNRPVDPWVIPSAGDRCDGCAGPLAAGTGMTTVLHLEADAPRRADLCEACGPAVEKHPGSFFWRRVVPDGPARSLVVDYALLREWFPVLLQRQGRVYEQLAYLVALVLVRKRKLTLRGFERRGGTEVMVVVAAKDGPALDVPAPLLSPDQLREASEQLRSLLRLEPGAPAAGELLDLPIPRPDGA